MKLGRILQIGPAHTSCPDKMTSKFIFNVIAKRLRACTLNPTNTLHPTGHVQFLLEEHMQTIKL